MLESCIFVMMVENEETPALYIFLRWAHVDLSKVPKPCSGIQLCIAMLIPFFSPRLYFREIAHHCSKFNFCFQLVFLVFSFGFFWFNCEASSPCPSAMELFSCTSKHPRLKIYRLNLRLGVFRSPRRSSAWTLSQPNAYS